MGVAKQRKAIVDGLRDAVHEFGESVKGTSAREVMNIVRARIPIPLLHPAQGSFLLLLFIKFIAHMFRGRSTTTRES